MWIAIAAGAAVITVFITWLQINGLKKTYTYELFSRLLKELSNDECRKDRAIISRISESHKPSIKSMISVIENEGTSTNYLPEMAIDRTIPRLDRIGYFILGDNNKLSLDPPPAWLWDIIESTYKQSNFWIQYRKSPDSGKYYSPHYGRYFERIHLYYVKNKNTQEKQYGDSDSSLQDC
jgi:hypothetical protein